MYLAFPSIGGDLLRFLRGEIARSAEEQITDGWKEVECSVHIVYPEWGLKITEPSHKVVGINELYQEQAMATIIYKIVGRDIWQNAKEAGTFAGAEIDIADGYIHFSTAAQVRETAAKHFAERTDLLLIGIDAESLGDALRWEPSRGGALFPHLYEPLPLSVVVSVDPLEWDASGHHVFPSHVAESRG